MAIWHLATGLLALATRTLPLQRVLRLTSVARFAYLTILGTIYLYRFPRARYPVRRRSPTFAKADDDDDTN
eukprot:2910180-Karenia_brevis.AAC.1